MKVWGVNDKGNYSEVECSTNKKNRNTGNYETDFSSKFVRFVGNAHKKRPQTGEKIKLTNCGVENVYEKDGERQYLKNPTYIVFDFEREGGNMPSGNSYIPNAYAPDMSKFEEIPLANESDLPF